MKKEEMIDKYLKISIQLQNNLSKLEELNKEKQEIIEYVTKSNNLTTEIKEKLNNSIIKYENLAKEANNLMKQSKKIKTALSKTLTDKEQKEIFLKSKPKNTN